MFCLNTSAKRNIPLPLLVVHSGNTTSGREALPLMLSNERNGDPDGEASNGGAWPVKRSIEKRDTSRNPVTGMWAVATLPGDCMLADPVPVRRPGVWVIGVDALDERGDGTASQTGSTKIGLKLRRKVLPSAYTGVRTILTGMLATAIQSMTPSWTQ